MASLTPEQRAELQGLAEQVMQDMDLAFEVDRLSANLASMFPDMGWDEPGVPGEGEGAMPLSATVDAMERLHDYEELDRSARQEYPGAAIEDVDEDAVRRTLGEEAVHDVRRLKRIERALEEAFEVAATKRPVLVDVRIDYSKRTRFTEGIVKTNLERFDLPTKARLVGRALWRRVTG